MTTSEKRVFLKKHLRKVDKLAHLTQEEVDEFVDSADEQWVHEAWFGLCAMSVAAEERRAEVIE